MIRATPVYQERPERRGVSRRHVINEAERHDEERIAWNACDQVDPRLMVCRARGERT
jgi:hypothetical protein